MHFISQPVGLNLDWPHNRLLVTSKTAVRHQVLPDRLAVASQGQALFDQFSVCFTGTWDGCTVAALLGKANPGKTGQGGDPRLYCAFFTKTGRWLVFR